MVKMVKQLADELFKCVCVNFVKLAPNGLKIRYNNCQTWEFIIKHIKCYVLLKFVMYP